jgi:hypothetical protein
VPSVGCERSLNRLGSTYGGTFWSQWILHYAAPSSEIIPLDNHRCPVAATVISPAHGFSSAKMGARLALVRMYKKLNILGRTKWLLPRLLFQRSALPLSTSAVTGRELPPRAVGPPLPSRVTREGRHPLALLTSLLCTSTFRPWFSRPGPAGRKVHGITQRE